MNFMVQWYPKMNRRRRMVKWQALASAAALGVVGVHLLLTYRSLSAAQAQASQITTDLSREQARVEQLDRLLGLRQQLESRQVIVDSLGLPVDASRVMTELAAAMGSSVSLSSVEMSLERRFIEADIATGSSQSSASPSQLVAQIKLMGVSPSTGEISQLYANIVRWPFASKVTFPRSQEVMQGDLITREFSMNIEIPLTSAKPVDGRGGVK
jgi:Tfp pilus assembly protein PilN